MCLPWTFVVGFSDEPFSVTLVIKIETLSDSCLFYTVMCVWRLPGI